MWITTAIRFGLCLSKLANANIDAQKASIVPDRYIVTLYDGTSLVSHTAFVDAVLARSRDASPVWQHKGILFRYHIKDFKSYAAHFDTRTANLLKRNKDVAHIEPDYVWHMPTLESVPSGAELQSSRFRPRIRKTRELGLHDISNKEQANPGTYWYDSSAGKSTFGYVVDGGIKIDHEEFEGRASLGFNAVEGPFIDDTDHGTHVASTIGGKTWGVAKRCNLIAVKVSRKGTQYTSTTLKGYAWAVKDIKKKGRQPRAVINISSSAPYSVAYNRAVEAAAAWGISTVVSAGNQARECDRSPASSPAAIAVGATTFKRRMAKFSSYGANVTMFAPGIAVQGAWIGLTGRSTTASIRYSGTSMSAPHVSGLVLYFKAMKFLPTAKMTKQHLLKVATPDLVKEAKGSPNYFAYNGSGK